MQPINHPELHRAAIRICKESNLSGYTNKLGVFVKIKTDGEKEMGNNMENIRKILADIKFDIFQLNKKITEQEGNIAGKAYDIVDKALKDVMVKTTQESASNKRLPRKEYRVTWRHELYFNANDDRHARDIWDSVDVGNLTEEAKRFTEEINMYSEFVEEKSFECVDDDYRDIVKNPQ